MFQRIVFVLCLAVMAAWTPNNWAVGPGGSMNIVKNNKTAGTLVVTNDGPGPVWVEIYTVDKEGNRHWKGFLGLAKGEEDTFEDFDEGYYADVVDWKHDRVGASGTYEVK